MKKEKNLFSIGEIAKALGVTRRIILNYEQRGLIQPDIKEGTTGNRYYTIDSFTKLRSIRIFQNLGLSLDEIRAYFNDSSDILPLIRRLEKLRDELNLNIEKLYERVQTGEAQIKTIRLERQRIYPPQLSQRNDCRANGGTAEYRLRSHACLRNRYHAADVLHRIPYHRKGRGFLLRGDSARKRGGICRMDRVYACALHLSPRGV